MKKILCTERSSLCSCVCGSRKSNLKAYVDGVGLLWGDDLGGGLDLAQ